jgi:hypothetical protein
VDRVTSADSTNMFSDLPEPPHLVQMAAEGAWGGPSYAYRGAKHHQYRHAPCRSR